jgi:hypothetical protein
MKEKKNQLIIDLNNQENVMKHHGLILNEI